jgi:hypothetical protein
MRTMPFSVPSCDCVICLEPLHSIQANKATPSNPITPPLVFAAFPVKGTTVLDDVGFDDPVWDDVVVLAVLFKATQISGTSVSKAELQYQLLFLSISFL